MQRLLPNLHDAAAFQRRLFAILFAFARNDGKSRRVSLPLLFLRPTTTLSSSSPNEPATMSSLGKRSSPAPFPSSSAQAPPSSAPRAKRSKTDLLSILSLDSVDLALLSHTELIDAVETLKSAYSESQKELAAEKKKKASVLQPIQASVSGPENWTDEQVAAKAKQVGEVAHKVRFSRSFRPLTRFLHFSSLFDAF
jgi:hypothetical protein